MSDKLYLTSKESFFDYDKIHNVVGQPNEYLVCLDDNQIHLILTALKEAEWTSRWIGNAPTDEIEAFVANTEWAIVNGECASGITRALRAQYAAIAGLNLDISVELPDTINHTETGVYPVIADLVSKMDDLVAAISSLDISPEVDDMEEILDAVNVVLGGVAVLGA